MKPFEKRVNEAAQDLCLSDVSLLNRRGTLLQLSRKKVAEDGYSFRKGHSRSKVYGLAESSCQVKRPKFDEAMRDERLQSIEEELCDISRILQYKEKRLSQHEASKNYRLCEQVTEEMMDLKSKRRELEAEKAVFIKKARRAKARQNKRSARLAEDSESSDVDSILPKSRSRSKSLTPGLNSPSPSPCSPFASLVSPALSSVGPPDQNASSLSCGSPLVPICSGSRIDPINCESDLNTIFPSLSDDESLRRSSF